jgi:hypothetical protein
MGELGVPPPDAYFYQLDERNQLIYSVFFDKNNSFIFMLNFPKSGMLANGGFLYG